MGNRNRAEQLINNPIPLLLVMFVFLTILSVGSYWAFLNSTKLTLSKCSDLYCLYTLNRQTNPYTQLRVAIDEARTAESQFYFLNSSNSLNELGYNLVYTVLPQPLVIVNNDTTQDPFTTKDYPYTLTQLPEFKRSDIIFLQKDAINLTEVSIDRSMLEMVYENNEIEMYKVL